MTVERTEHDHTDHYRGIELMLACSHPGGCSRAALVEYLPLPNVERAGPGAVYCDDHCPTQAAAEEKGAAYVVVLGRYSEADEGWFDLVYLADDGSQRIAELTAR